MTIKEAVALRIRALSSEKNININSLARVSGMPSGTVYSMLNSKSQNPGIVSIKKICDGFNMTLNEFFDSDLFDDLDLEIETRDK